MNIPYYGCLHYILSHWSPLLYHYWSVPHALTSFLFQFRLSSLPFNYSLINTLRSLCSFPFLKKIYWLRQVLVGARSILIVACESFTCGMLTLSCSMWDLVPWPRIKPGFPGLGVQSLSRWTTREVACSFPLLQCCSNLTGCVASGSPEGLVKTQTAGSTFWVSDLGHLEWRLRLYISYQFSIILMLLVWRPHNHNPCLTMITLIELNRLRTGGEGDDRGWDGWMASLT